MPWHITTSSLSVRALFKEGMGPREQSAAVYHGDHSSGYRTCWCTALLVPLAPPLLARRFLTSLLSPCEQNSSKSKHQTPWDRGKVSIVTGYSACFGQEGSPLCSWSTPSPWQSNCTLQQDHLDRYVCLNNFILSFATLIITTLSSLDL